MHQAKNRANKIHNRTKTPKSSTTPTRFISLPTNSISISISNNLRDPNIRIATCTSKTIKDLIKPPRPTTNEGTCSGCIYAIPCSKCNGIYVGETSRPLKSRMDEHRRALLQDDRSNALTVHRNAFGHNFDLDGVIILKKINDRMKRKTIEAAAIKNFHTIAQRPGDINLHPNISHHILKENNLLIHADALRKRFTNDKILPTPPS